ncbi:hypothetical protein IRP63_14730 (plasmid) [Clostridium botulinum]|uniref:Uncharacterized protein n=1 Tax=Clostridium botulinum C/D str. DC5 TaxID=1443128 RepID=A0A0A0HY75_CLOBO|nr:hypothetical protein [Clostridium botulinum]KGM93353.1 hypothetical protein Z955_15380 [Clostridium botulinum C/D str. DC5]KOC56964.1 hypothetical protein ADU89_01890 [Clostridium botulinum]KOC57439.1 hypothetical protein ADU90_06430 [Clostridium botulinum]MCD3232682.1 hypothetical protein [Clostridium botulinum D/C]MCD3238388.1 hypothetical protein [Clostridium botulinum D/C]
MDRGRINGYINANRNGENKGIGGLIKYQIERKLTEKKKYKIRFIYILKIIDFWRREVKGRYEIQFAKYILYLDETNSSQSMKNIDEFEKFLKEYIYDYFIECKEDHQNKNIHKHLKVGITSTLVDSIEDIINYKWVNEILKNEGLCNDEQGNFNKQNAKNMIKKCIEKAY